MKNNLKRINGDTIIAGLIMICGMVWTYSMGRNDGFTELTDALVKAEEGGLNESCIATDSKNHHYVLKAFKVDDILKKGVAQK